MHLNSALMLTHNVRLTAEAFSELSKGQKTQSFGATKWLSCVYRWNIRYLN